jgi:uncharacterized protein YgiM (DUF1202 family)
LKRKYARDQRARNIEERGKREERRRRKGRKKKKVNMKGFENKRRILQRYVEVPP